MVVHDANREHGEIMLATIAGDAPAATAVLDRHLARIEAAAAKFIQTDGRQAVGRGHPIGGRPIRRCLVFYGRSPCCPDRVSDSFVH